MNNPLATFKNFVLTTIGDRVALLRDQEQVTQRNEEWADLLRRKTIENQCTHLLINRAKSVLSDFDEWDMNNYESVNILSNSRLTNRYNQARNSLINHIEMAECSVSWKEDQ